MSHLATANRTQIEAHQVERLQSGLSRILPQNRFYQEKFSDLSTTISSLAEISRLPFTLKKELVVDQQAHPLFGSNLTYPLSEYVRLHQTSGTTGKPLQLLDTQESWDWWADCWKSVY